MKVLKILLVIILFTCVCGRAQTFDWTKQHNKIANNGGNDLCCDVQENVYVVGHDTRCDKPYNCISISYFRKYDRKGKLIWEREFIQKSVYQRYPLHITIDNTQDLLICGEDSAGYFVKRYDTSGVLKKRVPIVIWGFNCWEIGVDKNNNFYLGGNFTGTFYFKNTTIISKYQDDFIIMKYNANDSIVWAQASTRARLHFNGTFSADNNGNTYIGGNFEDTLAVNGSTLIATVRPGPGNHVSSYLIKYDRNGVLRWAKKFDHSHILAPSVEVITANANGNILCSGHFGDTLKAGSPLISTANNGDSYIMKLDSNGTVSWVNKLNANTPYTIGSICFGFAEEFYFTGDYTKNIDPSATTSISIGNYTLVSLAAAEKDLFVAKGDNAGTFKWAINSKSYSGKISPRRITMNSLNEIFVTGLLQGDVKLGQDTVSYWTDGTIFLTKVIDEEVVSVNEFLPEEHLRVYPTPASTKLKVRINGGYEYGGKFILQDLNGRIIKAGKFAEGENEMDISALARGIYILVIESAQHDLYRKIIID